MSVIQEAIGLTMGGTRVPCRGTGSRKGFQQEVRLAGEGHRRGRGGMAGGGSWDVFQGSQRGQRKHGVSGSDFTWSHLGEGELSRGPWKGDGMQRGDQWFPG